MGLRLCYHAYRSGDSKEVSRALQIATDRQNGSISLNSPADSSDHDLRMAKSSVAHAFYYATDAHPFFSDLADILQCPWIELRIQEGDHWDYTLHQASALIDRFSTSPAYWGLSPETYRGDAALLAGIWQIAPAKIEAYLRHWTPELYTAKTRAYPTDAAAYGDYNQLFDFMRALDVAEPVDSIHELVLTSET
ncbi:MAG: hypothetical protein AAF591_14325 [Verrucomicrobiota bacterium]